MFPTTFTSIDGGHHMSHHIIDPKMTKIPCQTLTISQHLENMKKAQVWILETQAQLEKVAYGHCLATIETNLESHKRVHRNIAEFQGIVNALSVSPTTFRDDTSRLRQSYADLLKFSEKRQSYLESVYSFVQSSTRMLDSLHEQIERTLRVDWNCTNSKQLELQCGELESLVESLEVRGVSLILVDHPASKCIQTYKDNILNQWSLLLRVNQCLEIQIRRSEERHQFFQSLQTCERQIALNGEKLHLIFSNDDESIVCPSNVKIRLQQLQAVQNELQLCSARMDKLEKSIIPTTFSVSEASSSITSIFAVCNWPSCDHVDVIKSGDPCSFLAYLGPHNNRWKVRTLSGLELDVPAVNFAPNPSKQEGDDESIRALRRFYDRTLNLCHKKQFQVRLNPVRATIQTVHGWNLAQFLAESTSRKNEMWRTLNEDAEKIFQENHGAIVSLEEMERLKFKLKQVCGVWEQFQKRGVASQLQEATGSKKTDNLWPPPTPSGGINFNTSGVPNGTLIQGQRTKVKRLINIYNNNNNLAQKLPPVTSLPPCDLPVPLYTGREHDLAKIHEALVTLEPQKKPLQRLLVLAAMGGMGKTEMTKKYAMTHKPYHKQITWVNAETLESIKTSFFTIARHLKICPDILQKSPNDLTPPDTMYLVDGVYDHFSKHVKKGLFIFDNAVQMRTDVEAGFFGIFDFLPKKDLPFYPLFLITSRNKDWGIKIPVIQLTEWRREDTLIYLRKAFKGSQDLNDDDDDDDRHLKDSMDPVTEKSMNELCKLLGDHPLAICLAAQAISTGLTLLGDQAEHQQSKLEENRPRIQSIRKGIGKEIKRFQKEFHKNEPKWATINFQGNAHDPYDQMMGQILETTLDRISRQSSDQGQVALDLLKVIAYLPPDSITMETAYCYYASMSMDEYKRMGEERQNFLRKAFGILEQFCLVSLNHTQYQGQNQGQDQNQPVRVHRLVQKLTRVILLNQENYCWLLQIAQRVLDDAHHFRYHQYPELTHYPACLLVHLRVWKWPVDSYRFAVPLTIAGCQGQGDGNLSKLGLKGLHDVYGHMKKLRRIHKLLYPEYFDLCQMLLMYFHHEEFRCPAATLPNFLNPFPPPLPHALIHIERGKGDGQSFCDLDPLPKVQYSKQLLDWILEQAMEHKENTLIQECACHILYNLMRRFEFRKYQGSMSRLKFYILQQYRQVVALTSQLTNEPFDVALKYFQIAQKFCLLPPTMLVPWVVRFGKARVREWPWKFIFLTIRSLPAWPRGCWTTPIILEAEAWWTCTTFLENGGIDLLSNLFEDTRTTYLEIREDYREEMHFVDDETLLGFVLLQEMTFIDECAELMLKSGNLIYSMKRLLDAATKYAFTPKQNILDKIVVAGVLISWVGLLSAPQIRRDLKTTSPNCADLVEKGLESFRKRQNLRLQASQLVSHLVELQCHPCFGHGWIANILERFLRYEHDPRSSVSVSYAIIKNIYDELNQM